MKANLRTLTQTRSATPSILVSITLLAWLSLGLALPVYAAPTTQAAGFFSDLAETVWIWIEKVLETSMEADEAGIDIEPNG